MLGLNTISNKLKTIIAIVAFLVFSGGLLYAGYWYSKPTIKDLSERNLALAAQDSTRLIELGELRFSYERAVFDFVNEKELREFAEDSMGNVTAALVLKSDADDRTIESLVTANATLRERLTDSVTVESSDVGFDVGIDTEKRYEDGSIAVAGTVAVDTTTNPPSGLVDISVSLVANPTVSISRSDDGLAQCDLSFGDMPISVEDLFCVNDLDPDLGIRRSVWGLFGSIGLTGGVALGLAVLVALAAL